MMLLSAPLRSRNCTTFRLAAWQKIAAGEEEAAMYKEVLPSFSLA